MDVLIAYPENKKQLAALKAVMKAMKVTFEQKSNLYPDHVVNGVKESIKQAEGGKLTACTDINDVLDNPLQQK